MVIKTKSNALPNPDTFADLLLTLTALSGEFPSALVSRLPGSGYYNRNMVTRMKKDELLYKYSRDGLHGLRLTAQAKQLLLARQPDRYAAILSGNTAANAPKYEVPYRLRYHRMAEATVTMQNAGVTVYPWEKPEIFQTDDGPLDIRIDQPLYYTSFEVKSVGEEHNKITGSRAAGVLLTPSRVFAVYNTGSTEMKLEPRSEERLKIFLWTELFHTKLPEQYFDAKSEAIMLASDMSLLEPLMDGSVKAPHKNFNLDVFDHFHFVTNDHYGETLLQILCDDRIQMALSKTLLEELPPSRPYFVENDAFDEDGNPVLLGYTCDMPRIRRFRDGLELHDLTGMMFCFDFQKDVLRRVCGPRIKIESIGFNEYKKEIPKMLWKLERYYGQ